MKTHKFVLRQFTYTIDFPILMLFFGNFLDIISTSLFVLLNTGTEANFILKDLISISIWFIPVYLLFSTNSVFIPFLSEVLRKTFGYTFGLMSILFGLNNFSLLIFNYAVLLENVSYNTTLLLYFLLGLPMFVYFIKNQKMNKKQIMTSSLKLVIFISSIALSNFIFIIINWAVNLWDFTHYTGIKVNRQSTLLQQTMVATKFWLILLQ